MEIATIIIKREHIDDFAKERNRALSAVERGKWVLFLDSDETLSSELKVEIENLNSNNQINGYYIPRKGIVEERLLRLAKKGAGDWERCVHEVWKIKGKVGYLENPIIHNEDVRISEIVKKADFYSTLHAKANKLEKKKSNLFKIIFLPFFKFFQTLFIKKAYKRGTKGFVFSLFQGFQSFLSWTKLYFSHS